jgi:hypothetical protein
MRLALLALAAAVLLPRTSLAAEPKKAEPTAVVLSRFVLSEDTWKKMQAGSAAQLEALAAQSARQAGTELPPDFARTFSDEFMKMISYQEMIDLQASLLAKYYTSAEMEGLLAFYKTPLGQKAIQVMPEISQDVTGQLLAIMQQRVPALMERVRARSKGGSAAPRSAPSK